MKQYLDRLAANKENPSELSKLHLEVAYAYAKDSSDYESYLPEILTKKRELMKEHSTVSKAEQAYELTNEGEWEARLKIRLKGYEKLLSGLKRRIESLAEESRNQY